MLQLFMWIVTSCTPQAPSTTTRAHAQRQLFHVADDFEIARRRSLRHDISVDRVCIFQGLARNKIAQLRPGIRNARDSKQMALLADAVPGGAFEFCRIDDCFCTRICKVSFGGTVAAFAGDAFGGKDG